MELLLANHPLDCPICDQVRAYTWLKSRVGVSLLILNHLVYRVA